MMDIIRVRINNTYFEYNRHMIGTIIEVEKGSYWSKKSKCAIYKRVSGGTIKVKYTTKVGQIYLGGE